ncbi:MAG: DUF924 family protein [Hyphomicrobiaceae bacterium]
MTAPGDDWVQQVIAFWTEETPRERWFKSTPELDREIVARFGALHKQLREAGAGTNDQPGAREALASLIVLDQFSRNMFRGTPAAFACDPIALAIARSAVARGLDQSVAANVRLFFYLPFEHSENRADQDRAVALFEALGDDNYLTYAKAHRDVVQRFGRFPHRNATLGRVSTPEEVEFLKQPGSSF